MNNIVTTDTNTEVVIVTAPGPVGPVGPQGPKGERGTVEANSGFLATPYLNVSGAMAVTGSSTFSGSVVITGSLTVSGSNTFINIGPALFTGSVGVSGSLFATTFSGSGAGLTNIPASGITGLNLSRIATANVSASVAEGGTSFTLNSGGTNLFAVSSTGLGTFANGLTVNGSTANFNNGISVNNASATLNQGLTVNNGATLNGGATINNGATLKGGTVISSSLDVEGTATLNGAAILTSATVSTNRITDSNISASVSATGKAFSVNDGATELASVDQQGAISGSGLNITSGVYDTVIDTPNIRLEGNATLNGQPITTAGDLTLNQIKSGAVTASVSTGVTSFTVESAGTNLLTISNTGLATISSSINIGKPSDDSYTDGFFDTFTENTKLSDAIDEISAAFLDLAPAKAGTLVGTNLTKVSPSTFSGRLAGGLNANDWYVGTSAYSNISLLTSTTTVDLDTLDNPGSVDRFRAGKYSDFSPVNQLVGGVTSSKAIGNAALAVSSTRALNSGIGSTGTIQITNIARYNTFWVKANARINDTLTATGSYKYTISADNGAGTTNTYQLWYVGGASDYPNQSVSAATPVTSSTTFNFLSGIPYLKTATFTLGITGSNLFNPVYNLNQISFASSYFSTLSTGSNAPNFDDTLLLNVNTTLAADLSSGQNFPTFTVTATKPGKSNAGSGTITLTNQKVNSYLSAQSTNTTEYFLDEARRYGDFQTTSWDSTATLTDGNLQVQNGRLIAGRAGDYSGFTATTQEYFRALTVGAARSSGTHTFSVSSFTTVSAWGSGGDLEIAFVKVSDVTGAKTASTIWDFGRAFGDNSGNIRGIVTSGTGLSGAFSLGTANSGTGALVLYIKYNGVTTVKTINQFTVTM